MQTPPTSVGSALPVQFTGFIGRESEVGALRQLLAGSRLLTLTGAGGSGKTRLALETVSRPVGSVWSDVVWIELAALADPGSLAAHVAVAIGVRAEGVGSAEHAVIAALRGRPLLLVLDNCEHLVDECARLVQALLAGCPDLRILATSREALGVDGERSWLVPGLSVPEPVPSLTPEAALTAESVRLFVERARSVRTGFELTPANVQAVVRICRRLDGMPLAVELAAARVGVLAPEQIAERLDDRFALLTSTSRSALPRHRTLRATMDWSYQLLSDEERLLLQRLSVFAGGFTLTAAEEVCKGGEIPESQVLDLLSSLVSRSLVAVQEEEGRARYRLLETVRQYAADHRRARQVQDDVQERHVRYFLALATALESEVLLGRPARLRQLDIEHDNLREALAWSAEHSAGSRYGLPIAKALTWYWFHRQLWREGFRHYEVALQTAIDPPPALRAAAMHGLGTFGLYTEDPLSASRLEEADAICRTLGDKRLLTFTLLVRTVEASLRHDAAAARALANDAVAVARETGEPWCLALVQAHALAPVLIWEQDWEAAARTLAEAEQAYRSHEYRIGVAYVLDARAFVALQQGFPSRAAMLARASLREDPTGQNRWLAGRSLRTLGAVALARDELERAAWLFGAAQGMYAAIGARALTAERRAVNELPERLRNMMSPEVYEAQWSAGHGASFDAVVAFALEGSEGGATRAEDVEVAAPSASVQRGVARLQVKALGPLEILRDGQSLPPHAWRHARPRELLLYLLAYPEGRTREQVGLDFWPDVAPTQVKNNFHVTLHHLRKAVGGDLVVYRQDRYGVDLERGVEFDAGRFERAAAAALRRPRMDRSGGVVAAEVAASLSDALALYRGPFLEGQEAGDWHLPIRERLARLHEECLDALADYYVTRNEPSAATDTLRRLLSADPLHESAIRRLMTVLAGAGRGGEAVREYERFASAMADELDAQPGFPGR
jgi:non-specific serine/threonine protein kinase